jgi:hypothetical protein
MTITLNGTTGITTPAIDNQGNLTVDTNTLVVDSANNRVGVGTSSPIAKLHTLSLSTTATVAKFGATNYGNLGTTYVEIGTQYGDGGSRIGNINPTGNLSTLVFETMTAASGVFAERMRIDSAGRVTMPYQPMFRSGGNASNTTVTVNTQEFVPFSNTPIINVGGHFNNATSRFTAPVSGIYYVGFSIMLSANFLDYTYFWTSFTVNGNGLTNLEFMLPRAGGGAYTTHQGNTYLSLTAGDYVQVRYYQSQGTAIQIRDSFRSFQGHLVG